MAGCGRGNGVADVVAEGRLAKPRDMEPERVTSATQRARSIMNA
jgi:hypothetical protein